MLASLSTKKKGIQSVPTSHIYLHTHYSENLLKITTIFHQLNYSLKLEVTIIIIFTITNINISIYTINYFYY